MNYDLRNWELITDQLMRDHTVIPVINRAQIVGDALNLARAGLLDYRTAMQVVKYLQHERDYLPWEAALSSLDYVEAMTIRSPAFGSFKVRIQPSHFAIILK